MSASVEFIKVAKRFGKTIALHEINFSVQPGEFFAMLGPSGSGKTTCLRLLAGFDFPSAGQVLLNGQDISRLAPYERTVNTVFQDYALFPHMNVLDNVAYGLMVVGVGTKARHKKACEMLEMVRLGDLTLRRTTELSGGQKQRIALARALVNQPKILLLDEPLGALDLKLRGAMQTELKQLQKQLGLTFIYVTHDQGEALSMSDRVAVFSAGRIEQIDTPQQLYNRPGTEFVARFVGSANVLDNTAIRPEYVHLGAQVPVGMQAVPVRVLTKLYHGAITRVECVVRDGSDAIAAHLASNDVQLANLQEGSELFAYWQSAHSVALRAPAV